MNPNLFVNTSDLIFDVQINNHSQLILGLAALKEYLSGLSPSIHYDLTLLPWDLKVSVDAIPDVEDNDLYQIYRQAVIWHGDQRYGDKLYAHHLKEVWLELIDAGATPIEQKNGILHDVGEDVNEGLSLVLKHYGQETHDDVDACSGFGANRKERNTRIHDLLLTRPNAVNAKISDRLVNMRNSVGKPKYMQMYQRELYQWEDILNLPNVLPLLRERFIKYADLLTDAVQSKDIKHENVT